MRKAIQDDSAALIELTALTPMNGRISLRIDRKPDFFRLLQQRGNYLVIVAENDDKKIVGCFSATRQQFIHDKMEVPVYYLGDLKVHPAYNNHPIAFRLISAMQKEICSGDVDLFVCTAVDGNEAVSPFFAGRTGFPPFHKTGVFNVYQLLPKRYPPNSKIEENVDIEELAVFYSACLSRYCLYPVLSQLENCLNLVIREEGKIVAALSLYDAASLKQNVIIDYPFGISMLLHVLRGLKTFLPMPSLPSKGKALKLLYARFFGFTDKGEQWFPLLIRAARTYSYEHQMHFIAFAADEKDEVINRIIKPLSRFNFKSVQFVTSLSDNKGLVNQICNNPCYEDYSLI